MPVELAGTNFDFWDLGLRLFRGEEISLQEYLHTQVQWMLIGPFGGETDLGGHNVAYPPEQEIDLAAQMTPVNGKAGWIEYTQGGGLTSVDLTQVYQPTDNVTAYALCYVTPPHAMPVQLRLGTNDAGKMWVGGELLYDHAFPAKPCSTAMSSPYPCPKARLRSSLKSPTEP